MLAPRAQSITINHHHNHHHDPVMHVLHRSCGSDTSDGKTVRCAATQQQPAHNASGNPHTCKSMAHSNSVLQWHVKGCLRLQSICHFWPQMHNFSCDSKRTKQGSLRSDGTAARTTSTLAELLHVRNPMALAELKVKPCTCARLNPCRVSSSLGGMKQWQSNVLR